MRPHSWVWPDAGWVTHSQMLAIPAHEFSDPGALCVNPGVSVLMMTRNHVQYLEQAVLSVLEQSFGDPIELLIGEDHSDDATLQEALRLQQKAPGIIRIITADRNVGIRSNFLRLVCRSRAPLIALLEGDDYWTDPLKLQLQCDLIRSHPEYALVAAKTANRHQWLPDLPVYDLPLLLRRYAVHTSSLLIRREHLHSYPCFPDNVCWESMLLGYLLARGTCGFLPVEMSYYRRHHGGLWHNADRLKRLHMSRECIDALDSYFFRRFSIELADREIWIHQMDATLPTQGTWRHWRQTCRLQLAQASRLFPRAPLAYLLLLSHTSVQPLLFGLQRLRCRLALGSRWRRLRATALP